jgi:hypothetical protein
MKSRARSPGPGAISGSESDASPIRRGSRAASREPVRRMGSDIEESSVNPDTTFSLPVDPSEDDLSMRLEIARKNSLSQSTGSSSDRRPARRQPLPNPPVEPIYESERIIFHLSSDYNASFQLMNLLLPFYGPSHEPVNHHITLPPAREHHLIILDLIPDTPLREDRQAREHLPRCPPKVLPFQQPLRSI